MPGYQLAARGVIRLSDNLTVTRDMAEWQDYRAWLKAGNQPDPMPVVVVPRWPSIAAGQADVWAGCKLRRDAIEATSFPYLGHPLDSDPRSVQRINTSVQAAQAAMQAGQPFSVGWTCMDGHVLPLDANGMIMMPVALAQYANELHLMARAFKERIAAATTEAELIAIEVEIAGEWVA